MLEGGAMLAGNGKTIPFERGDRAPFPAGQAHGGLTNTGEPPLVALTTHIIEIGKPMTVPAEQANSDCRDCAACGVARSQKGCAACGVAGGPRFARPFPGGSAPWAQKAMPFAPSPEVFPAR